MYCRREKLLHFLWNVPQEFVETEACHFEVMKNLSFYCLFETDEVKQEFSLLLDIPEECPETLICVQWCEISTQSAFAHLILKLHYTSCRICSTMFLECLFFVFCILWCKRFYDGKYCWYWRGPVSDKTL